MAGVSGPKLHPVDRSVRMVQAWPVHRGLDEVAAAAVSASFLAGAGELLPAIWLRDAVVAPLVAWDVVALAERLAQGGEPISDARQLSTSIARGGYRSPLTLAGFVALSPYRRSRRAVWALNAYAPVVVASPAEPDFDDSVGADLDGATWVVVARDRAEVVLQGNRCATGPVADETSLEWSLMCEQMFDLARRLG